MIVLLAWDCSDFSDVRHGKATHAPACRNLRLISHGEPLACGKKRGPKTLTQSATSQEGVSNGSHGPNSRSQDLYTRPLSCRTRLDHGLLPDPARSQLS